MSELLPTLQADHLKRGLLDYLTTTFALAEKGTHEALKDFIQDPVTGIFKGPYLRLRRPYQPAEEGWEQHLDWLPKLTPYAHQAAAYARLTTKHGTRPQPTLITTGTGSGKTEAFLHPILDHCVRSHRAGIPGTKALILYPMNALANDQAGRLAHLLTSDPRLAGLTAALYTGQDGTPRTRVTPDGLITHRDVIRDRAPDIILTNYKMLDQLLLRDADQPLWKNSAQSLTYLVLDEFHTYDGAQGTDVAMLLRRLGLALKHHHPHLPADAHTRPLGTVTPVATSATLGDGTSFDSMAHFASTVFGEEFTADDVVTETRLTTDQWVGDAVTQRERANLHPRRLAHLNEAELAAFKDIPTDDASAVARTVLAALHTQRVAYEEDFDEITYAIGDTQAIDRHLKRHPDTGLLTLAKAHPDVQALTDFCEQAQPLSTVAHHLFGATYLTHPDDAHTVTALLIGALSHVRATSGRNALGVDLNLWVRELTRLNRRASSTPEFQWGDDGRKHTPDSAETSNHTVQAFPAIYCRNCGRSGWMIKLAATGTDLHPDDSTIRSDSVRRDPRLRALLHAPAEAARPVDAAPNDDVVWFDAEHRTVRADRPTDPETLIQGSVLPVLMHQGLDADDLSIKQTCPACLHEDSVIYLGSRIVTLLSVGLTSLFGSAHLDAAEKKVLVFTDSVQDAAHRAGYIEARAHVMTRRAALRDVLTSPDVDPQAGVALDDAVVHMIERAADDPHRRFRLVAPDMAGNERLTSFWKGVPGSRRYLDAANKVVKRLLFDATLECGLNATYGRTLENTGSVSVEVDAGDLLDHARHVYHHGGIEQLGGTPPSDAQLVAWARGTLERLRLRGGIDHPWLKNYLHNDGARYYLWGGRPRSEGMPAFPTGRSAPRFPQIGGTAPRGDSNLSDPVTPKNSWYAVWAMRTLGVNDTHGAVLAKALLERLAAHGVLTAYPTKAGGTAFALPPARLRLTLPTDDDLTQGRTRLVCDECSDEHAASPTTVAQLHGHPCLVTRCSGRLHATPRSHNFYRELYANADMRRVIAREHSSLLPDVERLPLEEAFRDGSDDPTAPNVLVATPTLEMGIDIGDLSAVVLANLPATVSSYLQRVGRAGRLTGNALTVAYATGRGAQLPHILNPLSIINGAVLPPATYLDAEEILRRQYLAHLVDLLARTAQLHQPRWASQALSDTGPGFLTQVIAFAHAGAPAHLDRFLHGFTGRIEDATIASLRDWATPSGDGGSGLSALLCDVQQRWNRDNEELQRRLDTLIAVLPQLETAAERPAATDEEKRDFRSARAASRLVRRQLEEHRKDHWIGVLERYGVLPNYTLLDDSVTLDVGMSWYDPEDGGYHTEPFSIERPSARALREFAPGAYFYGRGLKMKIDGVDLGAHHCAVRPYAWCACCGYAVDVEPAGVRIAVPLCPRCGDASIADVRQTIDVVELTTVFSEINRDDAHIDDGDDDRRSSSFVLATAADLNPDRLVRHWHEPSSDFGVAYYSGVDIRWVNGGPSTAAQGALVAGTALPSTLFRICHECGKVDTAANRNSAHEHRPWCSFRHSLDEKVRQIALIRTLTTQALALQLPFAVAMDAFGPASVRAALLLGLHADIGGRPDHLNIVQVNTPAPQNEGVASPVRTALLLHDLVPGGTGYLADLANPDRLRRILLQAWTRLRECPCIAEGLSACHLCLLPYTHHDADAVHRATAERHLRAMLWGDHDPCDANPWHPEEGASTVAPTESALELNFRAAFKACVESLQGRWTERPGPLGNVVTITGIGESRWTLTPQELAHGCKPDFVLRSDNPNIPPLAIFTDGYRFHASPECNRVRDDAEKRATLRAHGFEVLAVTFDDIRQALAPEGSRALRTVTDTPWLPDSLVATLKGVPHGVGFGVNSAAVDAVRAGPLGILMFWLTEPTAPSRKALANAVWFALVVNEADRAPLSVGLTAPASELVAALRTTGQGILDGDPTGAGEAFAWRPHPVSSLAACITGNPHDNQAALALVLDDRAPAVARGTDYRNDWRAWLHLTNALIGCTHPLSVTCVNSDDVVPLTRDDAPITGPLPVVAPAGAHPTTWKPLEADLYSADTLRAAEILQAQGVTEPEFGTELGDGIPVDFAWPAHRVAATTDPDPDEVASLAAEGWQLLPMTPDAIRAALQEGR